MPGHAIATSRNGATATPPPSTTGSRARAAGRDSQPSCDRLIPPAYTTRGAFGAPFMSQVKGALTKTTIYLCAVWSKAAKARKGQPFLRSILRLRLRAGSRPPPAATVTRR